MTPNETIQNGIRLVESGNIEEGMKLINKAISLDPSDPEKLHVRAQIHSAIGKHQEAIADYKKCIFLNDDIFQYHYNLANVYFDTRQFAQAVDYYSAAIRLNPTDSDIYSNRGTCYIQISQPKLAYDDFKKALSMNPNDQPAKRGLNILLSVDPTLGK
jgi:tetratricopeptide (TPR) repeat protein